MQIDASHTKTDTPDCVLTSGSQRWSTFVRTSQLSSLGAKLTSGRTGNAWGSWRPTGWLPSHTHRWQKHEARTFSEAGPPKAKNMAALCGIFAVPLTVSPPWWFQGEQTQKEINAALYLECSAKFQENVDNLFRQATKKALAFNRKQRKLKRKKKCVIFWGGGCLLNIKTWKGLFYTSIQQTRLHHLTVLLELQRNESCCNRKPFLWEMHTDFSKIKWKIHFLLAYQMTVYPQLPVFEWV